MTLLGYRGENSVPIGLHYGGPSDAFPTFVDDPLGQINPALGDFNLVTTVGQQTLGISVAGQFGAAADRGFARQRVTQGAYIGGQAWLIGAPVPAALVDDFFFRYVFVEGIGGLVPANFNSPAPIDVWSALQFVVAYQAGYFNVAPQSGESRVVFQISRFPNVDILAQFSMYGSF